MTVNRRHRIDADDMIRGRQQIEEEQEEFELLSRVYGHLCDRLDSEIKDIERIQMTGHPPAPRRPHFYFMATRREGLEYFCDTILRFEEELCSYFGVENLNMDAPESRRAIEGKLSEDIQVAYSIYKTLLEVLMIPPEMAKMISCSNRDKRAREETIRARAKVYERMHDRDPSKFHELEKELYLKIDEAHRSSIELFMPLLEVIDKTLRSVHFQLGMGTMTQRVYELCRARLSRRPLQRQGVCVEDQEGSLEELLPQFKKGTIHGTRQILETGTRGRSYFTGDCGIYSWEDGRPVLYICGPEMNLVLTGFREYQRQHERAFSSLLASQYGVDLASYYTLPDEGITDELRTSHDVLRIELSSDGRSQSDRYRIDSDTSGTTRRGGRKTLRDVLGDAPVYVLNSESIECRTKKTHPYVICVPIIITEKGDIDVARSFFGDRRCIQRHHMRGEVIDSRFCLDY